MNISEYLNHTKLSQQQFGELVGVTQGMVHQWIKGITQISTDKAKKIHFATDGLVDKAELRPDIWGEDAA